MWKSIELQALMQLSGMPARKKSSIPDNILKVYDKMIEALEGIERKGATMPYTSLNGHMFSFLDAEGRLSLRLSTESREAFIDRHQTKLAEQHGAILKEYVVVPDELFQNVRSMKEYFRESYEYVKSMKPKKAPVTGGRK